MLLRVKSTLEGCSVHQMKPWIFSGWPESSQMKLKKKGGKKSFKDWKDSEHICFSLVFIDHAVREEMSVVSLSLGVTWPLLLNPIKRNLSLHPNVMLRKIYTISMKDQEGVQILHELRVKFAKLNAAKISTTTHLYLTLYSLFFLFFSQKLLRYMQVFSRIISVQAGSSIKSNATVWETVVAKCNLLNSNHIMCV